MDDLFPKIQKSIENLIEDEEGNIPGKKLLMLGTMVMILGSLIPMEVLAGHRSHSSHRSHGSHSSHSSGSHGSGSHSSHVSHQSHVSSSTHGSHSNHSNHGSHSSHTSHSNTNSHSNSLYSAEGDVTYGPPASSIPGIATPPVQTENTFVLPDINQNIETPNATPGSGIVPSLALPAATVKTYFEIENIKTPSSTNKVE